MTRLLPSITAVVLLTLPACGGSETSDSQLAAGASSPRASTGGAPRVESAHQKNIDEAWQKALAGENPANDCARVKGTVIGTRDPEGGRQALQACNVEIPVRYFQTILDKVERGEETCQGFMMEMITKLPAMTMDLSGLESMVERGGVSDKEAPDAARDLIGSAMSEGTKNSDDPKQMIKARIAERAKEMCPDTAAPLQL